MSDVGVDIVVDSHGKTVFKMWEKEKSYGYGKSNKTLITVLFSEQV